MVSVKDVRFPRFYLTCMQKWLRKKRAYQWNFKINGENIELISYAEDNVWIANTLQKLQQMVNALNEAGKKEGLTMNTNKTKVMKIERKNDGQ